jgi:ubiquinone/menaquinone biosynthesis C-methylase UbiE
MKRSINLKCKICGKSLVIGEERSITINHVPDSTFHFSNKTVDLHIVDCKFCGCVQLVNVPLSKKFTDVYRSIGISKKYREEKKKQIRQFVEYYRLQDADTIEVGCGDGQFLEVFNELGLRKIVGLESGFSNYEVCRRKGFKVIYGKISQPQIREKIKNQFDLVTTFHYLEHWPDPIRFLRSLYRIIKPGGLGLIEVPNYDFIEKNNIWLEFTKDHRIYYRKRTLCYLVNHCGFSLEAMEENNQGICLTVIVKKLEKGKLPFVNMKKCIQADIIKFKKTIDGLSGAFAIYGAGHYSQLLINNVYQKYGIKPIRIFDSNNQKHGNRICDAVIEPGDQVKTMKDFQNIIILCGNYNGEVFRLLKRSGKNLIQWGL